MRRSLVPAVVGLAAAALTASITAAPVAADGPTEEPDYEPIPESLARHDVPRWFDDAKFGIFVHWGVYSVPAWSGPGTGAEWYLQFMNSPDNPRFRPVYEHHRETYGEDFDYDDFIPQWSADAFEPGEWVDLFEDAGARYFVLTTKHHDGLALFDSAVSGRDTVDLGPGRDLVGELVSEARANSDLKVGLYYSLGEFFNPDLGRPMRNPYTGAELEFTGYPDAAVDDYVTDYEHAQVRELIDRYDPDLLWGDGTQLVAEGSSQAGFWKSEELFADYYNQAKNRPQPKEVTTNSRWGLPGGVTDYATAERSESPDISEQKWESAQTIGGSWGYKQNEELGDFRSSNELVDTLVNVVSKNGNLLLNVGPKPDGTIRNIEQDRLQAIGEWLDVNGEAIYGSTYWNHAEDPVSNVPVRYTIKDDALYVTALEWPGSELRLSGDLPLTRTSTVTLLGSDGAPLRWRDDGDTVTITMPDAGAAATSSDHAYTFKVSTHGVRQLLRTKLEAPAKVDLGQPFTATATVTNPSDRPAPGGEVALDVPAGWTVSPAVREVGGLASGESAIVAFTVTPPVDDAAAGRYSIRARASFGRFDYEADQVILAGLDNLALGKPATQKSLYQGSRGEPELAVDGDTNGAWGGGSVTHTAEPESEAWWQVDLQEAHRLAEIAVWNRTDCCSDRLSDYYVLVSEQPFASDSLAETLAQPGVHAFHQDETAGTPTRIPVDVTGRYVRIQLTSTTNPLALAEVEVIGRPATD